MKNLSRIFIVGIGLLFVASMSYAVPDPDVDTSAPVVSGFAIHDMEITQGATLSCTDLGAVGATTACDTEILIDTFDNYVADAADVVILKAQFTGSAPASYGSSNDWYVKISITDLGTEGIGSIWDGTAAAGAGVDAEVLFGTDVNLVKIGSAGTDTEANHILYSVGMGFTPSIVVNAGKRLTGSFSEVITLQITSVDNHPEA